MAGSGNIDVVFEKDRLQFGEYPFLSKNKNRVLFAEEITEIIHSAPPSVRTKEGEFLYITARQWEQLKEFAKANGIPEVRRVDIWSIILDPFLDTQHGEEYMQRSMEILAANNVSEKEVKEMRQLVGKRMMALTSLTWEWIHYGLYDALSAMKPLCILSGWTFEKFYYHAMKLEDRGVNTSAIETVD